MTGFIVHASQGNTTELDALAVRFPYHKEPEREIGPCEKLSASNEKIEFLICEVKGGSKNAKFNNAFRSNKSALVSVLNRIGAFNNDSVVDQVADKLLNIMKPESINKTNSIPKIDVADSNFQVRCILAAPDQVRPNANAKPYIYGDDIINYIWQCFRPENRREACGTIYNWDLWGEQYQKLVVYFKDKERNSPGSMDDLYSYFEV